MPMPCPRCETEVPDEALYCPYCSLQKPRNGVVAAAPPEETTPVEAPKAPVAFRRITDAAPSKPLKRRRKSDGPRKLRLPVVSAAALVAFLGVGAYIFIVPLVHSQQAEPKTVLSALDKLRRMPSSEPNVTVDARMLRELEKSRRVGNLVGYQGWIVRPVKGTSSKVLLIFSYDEVGNAQQRAEWLADLENNTFTPQTDLAASVYAKR